MNEVVGDPFGLIELTDLNRWEEGLEHVIEEEAEMKARHLAEEKTIEKLRTRLQQLIKAGTAYLDIEVEDDEPSEDAREEVEKESRSSTPTTRQVGDREWKTKISRISARDMEARDVEERQRTRPANQEQFFVRAEGAR